MRPGPRFARCRSPEKRCCARCARSGTARRSAVELLRPSSPEEATRALSNGSRALAGGTELVPLMRDGLVRADTLVYIREVVPRGIDGTRIGAGTTLAELEADPQIPQALREPCTQAASPRPRPVGPIVGVAAARFESEIRIALAGVAPIPWTLDSPAALEEATPLPGTAYKAEIARVLVRRALHAVKSASR